VSRVTAPSRKQVRVRIVWGDRATKAETATAMSPDGSLLASLNIWFQLSNDDGAEHPDQRSQASRVLSVRHPYRNKKTRSNPGATTTMERTGTKNLHAAPASVAGIARF